MTKNVATTIKPAIICPSAERITHFSSFFQLNFPQCVQYHAGKCVCIDYLFHLMYIYNVRFAVVRSPNPLFDHVAHVFQCSQRVFHMCKLNKCEGSSNKYKPNGKISNCVHLSHVIFFCFTFEYLFPDFKNALRF